MKRFGEYKNDFNKLQRKSFVFLSIKIRSLIVSKFYKNLKYVSNTHLKVLVEKLKTFIRELNTNNCAFFSRYKC